MSSPNKSILVVIVLGGLIGLGAAIYYIAVVGPGREQREMNRQVEEWAAEKWYPARSCLVGLEPRAPNGRDAIVLRIAIPGAIRPSQGDCNGFFTDMQRPGSASSGSPQVESDWRELEAAVGRLAGGAGPGRSARNHCRRSSRASPRARDR